MKDHLLDNPSLPVMFIRQGLFNRMLRINTTCLAALINKFRPRQWRVLERHEYESMYVDQMPIFNRSSLLERSTILKQEIDEWVGPDRLVFHITGIIFASSVRSVSCILDDGPRLARG